jgi:hypothetical protein
MNQEINVLAMVKGEERYIFLYDDKNRTETLRMLGRYAADPQLSFTWYDAAVLSKKIREMSIEDELAAAERSRDRSRGDSSRLRFSETEDLI